LVPVESKQGIALRVGPVGLELEEQLFGVRQLADMIDGLGGFQQLQPRGDVSRRQRAPAQA